MKLGLLRQALKNLRSKPLQTAGRLIREYETNQTGSIFLAPAIHASHTNALSKETLNSFIRGKSIVAYAEQHAPTACWNSERQAVQF